MRLTDVLSEQLIKVPLEGQSKLEILRELIDLACAEVDTDTRENILESVFEREGVMSTGIGQGIALPHGTSPRAMHFAAALGIPHQPVDFNAIDDQPVTLIFLLISDEKHINTKMKALARISRLLHRQEFRTALVSCTTAAGAMQVITDEEARHRI